MCCEVHVTGNILLKKSETRQDTLYTIKARSSLLNLILCTVSGLSSSTTARKAAGSPTNSLLKTLASTSQILKSQIEASGDPSMMDTLTEVTKKIPKTKDGQKVLTSRSPPKKKKRVKMLRHGRDVHPTWVKLSTETLSNTGSGVLSTRAKSKEDFDSY